MADTFQAPDTVSPPPLPPQSPVIPALPTVAYASGTTDENLLKRASYAGRILLVLAILSTLGTILSGIMLFFFVKAMPILLPLMAAAVACIAAGYWVLAAGARRGNPNAVSVAIVIMALQLASVVILAGVDAARNDTSLQPNIPGIIIPGLVLAALYCSREVLLDLKKRQLWAQVFGAAKPSEHLCIIGGALLLTGITGFDVGFSYIQAKTDEAQQAESRNAEAFLKLLHNEEQTFIEAMHDLARPPDPGELEVALRKHDSLEKRLQVLNK